MLDEADHLICPSRGVLNSKIIAVEPKKVPHRLKGRAFVSLLECMCTRDPRHQRHGKHHDVLFAECKEVLRARKRALKQPPVAEEMPLSRVFHLEPIVLDYRLNRQPHWLTWQGPLGSSGTS